MEQGNPAGGPEIGGVLDLFARTRGRRGGSGLDLELRSLELTLGGQVAPDSWARTVFHADEEELLLEEAAIEILHPFDGATLHAGRFFTDFGQQMQLHIHQLRSPERPLVLREYLGEELAGTGLQLDQQLGEDLELSFAAFDSLLDSHGHGGGHRGHSEEQAELSAETGGDSLDFTLRLSGAAYDVGRGDLEWGLSLREVPDFAFEVEGSGLGQSDLSNRVLGVDAAWSVGNWSLGAEALQLSGDIGAEVDDGGTPDDSADDTLLVLDDDVLGYYAWIERALGETSSLGLLLSSMEHPEAGKPEDTEVTLYYTRKLGGSSRLRLALSNLDAEEGRDRTKLMFQFTSFFGHHTHRGTDAHGH